jgi:hypothetical protein
MGSSFKAEWGPAICMVLIELFTTGQMLLTKVVVDAGLFVFALLTYRFLIGTVLVVPLAVIFERSVRTVRAASIIPLFRVVLLLTRSICFLNPCLHCSWNAFVFVYILYVCSYLRVFQSLCGFVFFPDAGSHRVAPERCKATSILD